jgi:hypothetical protein
MSMCCLQKLQCPNGRCTRGCPHVSLPAALPCLVLEHIFRHPCLLVHFLRDSGMACGGAQAAPPEGWIQRATNSLQGIVYLNAEGTAKQHLAQVDTKIAEFKAAFTKESGLLSFFTWWEGKRGELLAALPPQLFASNNRSIIAEQAPQNPSIFPEYPLNNPRRTSSLQSPRH